MERKWSWESAWKWISGVLITWAALARIAPGLFEIKGRPMGILNFFLSPGFAWACFGTAVVWSIFHISNRFDKVRIKIIESRLEQQEFANVMQKHLTEIKDRLVHIEDRLDKINPESLFDVYVELTPEGKRTWTKEEIDKLSDTEKLKLKQNPDLWRWYLGG